MTRACSKARYHVPELDWPLESVSLTDDPLEKSTFTTLCLANSKLWEGPIT